MRDHHRDYPPVVDGNNAHLGHISGIAQSLPRDRAASTEKTSSESQKRAEAIDRESRSCRRSSVLRTTRDTAIPVPVRTQPSEGRRPNYGLASPKDFESQGFAEVLSHAAREKHF